MMKILDNCICCGACASACPMGAISMGDAHYEIDQNVCIGCGTCAGICPIGNIERV